MKKAIGALLLVAAVIAIIAGPLLAKGSTVKLTISGPGLADPVTLTNQEAVSANVWAGDFVDWNAGPAKTPSDAPRYTVQFYVAPPRSEVKMMYVVDYVWDTGVRRALVRFPGRGDEWYRLNVSTILREGTRWEMVLRHRELGPRNSTRFTVACQSELRIACLS